MNDNDILKKFIVAARTIKMLSDQELIHHSVICNFPTPKGNGNGHCNCGVSDILCALGEYDKEHPEEAIEHFRKDRPTTNNEEISVGVCQGCGHMSKWGGKIEGSRQHMCAKCNQYTTVVFYPPKK